MAVSGKGRSFYPASDAELFQHIEAYIMVLEPYKSWNGMQPVVFERKRINQVVMIYGKRM
jgi:hypothetical protein